MKQKRLLVVVLAGLLTSLSAGAADFSVVNSGATAYVINGTNDPTLTLLRGQTYMLLDIISCCANSPLQ